MKAFLLAAGEGRRLRPLTDSTPKCLVPIRGTPLLALWLELLEREGVTDVLINLHHLAEKVEAFLRSRRTSLRVFTSHEDRLLGSAGTVLQNRDFVAGDEEFLVLYADNLTNADLRKMVSFHRDRPEPLTLGVQPTDRPQEKGIVVLDGDFRVTAFDEKPARPRSDLANAGIFVARSEVLDEASAVRPEGEVLDFGYHVLPRMLGRMNAYVLTEFLADIGTHEALERAQRAWPGLDPG